MLSRGDQGSQGVLKLLKRPLSGIGKEQVVKKWILLIVSICLLPVCASAQTAGEAVELGNRYFYGEGVERDDAKAFSYYMEAAEAGELEAICRVGQMYYFGYGAEQDPAKAFE